MNLAAPQVEQLEGGRIRLTRGLWSEEFPAEALPGRITFYRTLAARQRPSAVDVYGPMVAALVAADGPKPV